jgi:phosphoglycolate phosphatase
MRDPLVALLDLDGTLIDSAPGIVAGLRQALIAVDAPVPSESVLRTWIGPPVIRTLQTQLGERGSETWSSANAAFREYFDAVGAHETLPFPGILDALPAISDHGFTIVVVTNKPRALATLALEQHGLASHVEAVFAPHDANDTARTKVELMKTALTSMRAGRAVTAGDRASDLHAAAAHRLACVGVTWGYGTAAELAGCEAVIHSPEDLPGALYAHERRVARLSRSTAAQDVTEP